MEAPLQEHELDDPEVSALLPLAYVAWADGVLTPSEIITARQSLEQTAGLGPAAARALPRLLDPGQPPAPQELQAWLEHIRKLAAQTGASERKSLAGLGMGMARISGATEGGLSPKAQRALHEVEAALGLVGVEACRALLAEQAPSPTLEPAPALDLGALTRLLEGSRAPLRKQIKTLLRDPVFAHRYDLDSASYRERVLLWCRELARRGYGGLLYPESCGGRNDPEGFVAVFETLALHDLSLVVKFGVQFGLFGNSILQLGNARQQRDLLPRVASLELPGCFAMSETGHGSNVRSVETVARYDAASQTFELSTPNNAARKDYIGNAAAHGRLAVVFAQLQIDAQQHGVHAFLVPIRNEDGQPAVGVSIEDCGLKLGLNGVDNGRLHFKRVSIPRESLLDRFGAVSPEGTYSSSIPSPSRRFFSMLETLVGGRVGVACAAASAARVGLCIAIRYGQRRRQFGPEGAPELRLLDYHSHQRRLMPLLAKSYALHFALQELVQHFAEADPERRRELEVMAAGLKACSTWHTTRTLQICRECCGGQGYLAVNRFAALKADTDVFSTFEGDNTVLMQLVAKGLLSELKQHFGELKFFGLLRYLASQAASNLADFNPVSIRLSSEAHLRDAGFQRSLFEARESSLLTSVARRLKARIERGEDSFAAFIACQNHLLSVAEAHVETRLLVSFQAACAALEPGPVREALERLCSLNALACIEAHAGWYLEHEMLAPGKARALRKQVNKLCTEVRAQAVQLVDAWDIPDACLGAPIALPEPAAGPFDVAGLQPTRLYPWRAVWEEEGSERAMMMYFEARQDRMADVRAAFEEALEISSASSLLAFRANGFVHELPPSDEPV